MSDIGDVLGMLGQAREGLDEAMKLVAGAGEKLAEIAQRLAAMGIEDRAEITHVAAQSTEDATGALGGALDAVDNAVRATAQAGGSG